MAGMHHRRRAIVELAHRARFHVRMRHSAHGRTTICVPHRRGRASVPAVRLHRSHVHVCLRLHLCLMMHVVDLSVRCRGSSDMLSVLLPRLVIRDGPCLLLLELIAPLLAGIQRDDAES